MLLYFSLFLLFYVYEFHFTFNKIDIRWECINQWLGARLQYLHCLCTGDAAVCAGIPVGTQFFADVVIPQPLIPQPLDRFAPSQFLCLGL